MAATHPGKRWITLQDGLDNLKLEDAPAPSDPGADEVLVEIKAVSLNYRDTEGKLTPPLAVANIGMFTNRPPLVAMGLYNHHKSMSSQQPPLVPCSDMCGVVVAVGSGLSVPWKVGDRVLSTFNQSHLSGQIKAKDMGSGLGKPLDGVLQSYRAFPSTGLVRCPDYLTDEEGASLPIAAVTAWMAINQFRPLGQPGGEGETVVLQGTGGVAVAGLQIAKAAGAKGTFAVPTR
jgi:NADPH:quinone reductase-like Zn-dependent oxidoreductase